MIRLCFTLIILTISSISFASADTASYPIIPLIEGITQKKVTCTITGSFDPRRYYTVSDNSGMHYGKCMDVVLESLADTFILFKLDAGTSLIPDDSTLQTMYVTKTVEFPLYPRKTIPYNIYAMCGEMHDKSPYYGARYQLGNIADSALLNAIKIIEREYLQNIIGQHFLWSITDNASKEELVKYGADSGSLARTSQLLSASSIRCRLTEQIPPVNTEKDLRPAYMRIRKIYFYIGITYTILITAGMVLLLAGVYKRKKVI